MVNLYNIPVLNASMTTNIGLRETSGTMNIKRKLMLCIYHVFIIRGVIICEYYICDHICIKGPFVKNLKNEII